jgi:hypothetical protein
MGWKDFEDPNWRRTVIAVEQILLLLGNDRRGRGANKGIIQEGEGSRVK